MAKTFPRHWCGVDVHLLTTPLVHAAVDGEARPESVSVGPEAFHCVHVQSSTLDAIGTNRTLVSVATNRMLSPEIDREMVVDSSLSLGKSFWPGK